MMNGANSLRNGSPVIREYQMKSSEKTRAMTATDASLTNRGVCSCRWSASRHLSWAAAENAYGIAAVMPDM